jgi:hypothetical protein
MKEVLVESAAEKLAFASGQEMWDWVLHSNPLAGMAVRDLTEDQRGRLRQVLDEMLRRSNGSGPAILTNPVNIGVGTKRSRAL